jgi:hypothetical protein
LKRAKASVTLGVISMIFAAPAVAAGGANRDGLFAGFAGLGVSWIVYRKTFEYGAFFGGMTAAEHQKRKKGKNPKRR